MRPHQQLEGPTPVDSATMLDEALYRDPPTGLAPTYCVTNYMYVDQQTLKPDDDYVLPHQRLWTFDVLICPLSATERFLLQPLVCGTVFHRTSLLHPISPSSAVLLNHSVISFDFLIPLSDSSHTRTVVCASGSLFWTL